MANGKGITVNLWREGKNVIIRSDSLHITTYGKSIRQALSNFKEALSLTLDAMTERSIGSKHALPFEFELKRANSYGRTTAKNKAAASY